MWLFDHLSRMERVTRGHAGAGWEFEKGWRRDRWQRELAHDAPHDSDVLVPLLDYLELELADAWPDLDRLAGVFNDVVVLLEARDQREAPLTLYRLYGRLDLLYIGITSRGPVRLVEHSRTKPWWPQVRRVTFEPCQDRQTAMAREAEAIRSENPRHNVQHNTISSDALETPVTLVGFG
jgi:predicted GIY-YIG superfamily endonuclease